MAVAVAIGDGQERLHLVGAKAVALQPQRQFQHVLVAWCPDARR